MDCQQRRIINATRYSASVDVMLMLEHSEAPLTCNKGVGYVRMGT